MATKGTAVHTENLSVACTPELKTRAVAAARASGVNYSVVIRWALAEYLEEHFPEVSGDADGSGVAGTEAGEGGE